MPHTSSASDAATTPLDRPPAWVADAIFYQVFPDRFARSDSVAKPDGLEAWDAPPSFHGYKGGDLAGLTEKLDWIEHLGCNALYLNPIFQSASNHRYHTHDYFRVDPLLGGDQAFEDLLAACHDRGIRLVLDGVFNHASRGFFQFSDILEQGEASPWRDWFRVNGFPVNAHDESQPPSYEAWWGMHALPKFNTENPAVREYLMTVAEYWIERGVDGWRLDVPEEISTEGFWEEFRQRVRAKNPDAYIVGEIWGDAHWWTATGERFDGTMNYLLTGHNVSLASTGHTNWRAVERLQYSVEPLDAAGYAAAIAGLQEMYPEHALKAHLNLLGSHDTARVRTVCGEDATSVALAALLTFTFPGAPCVYYGDEVGMSGAHDPDNRRGFPWDWEEQWDLDTLETFRGLAGLRHDHPALRHGSYRTVHAPEGSHLYVFARDHESESLTIAVNAGDSDETVALERPLGRRVWGQGTAEASTLALPARSGGVWKTG